MNNNFQAICKLIGEIELIAKKPAPVPHNIFTVKQNVLQLELAKECEFLSGILKDPKTFEEKFRKRCAERAMGQHDAIGFDKIPNSATNTIYWYIAEKLFAPQTMPEMLEIICPQIKRQLRVSPSEQLIGSLKDTAEKGVESVLSLKDNLSDLKGELLKQSQLTHYVFQDDTVFDVKDIERFPLRVHAKLFEQLEAKHPRLCAQLYKHNPAFTALKNDISDLNNQGTTPKEAIQLLIKGLNLSGERMTGKEFASDSVSDVIRRFTYFMQSMPSHVQDELKKARGVSRSLDDILEKELGKGQCVQTAALHLHSVLEVNEKTPLFTNPACLTVDALKQLEKKYKSPINVEREDIEYKNLPHALIVEVLGQIKPKNAFEIITLLINFPTSLYKTLLYSLKDGDVTTIFETIAAFIKQGCLSVEQSNELASIIIDFYKFDLGMGLRWALKTNNPDYIQKAFDLIPNEERKNIIQDIDRFVETVVFDAVESPFALNLLLSVPGLDIEATVLHQNFRSDTILHDAARYPESLTAILGLLPESKRLEIVTARDIGGCSLLRLAERYPESLMVILKSLPESDRAAAVIIVLQRVASAFPESLEAVFSLVPESDRLDVIRATKDRYKETTILHNILTIKPEFLIPVLKQIPEQDRLAAVKMHDAKGDTILHQVARSEGMADVAQAILELIPEQDRLALVEVKNKDDNTALHEAIQIPEAFQLLHIPVNRWSELFNAYDFESLFQKTLNLTGIPNLYNSIARLKAHADVMGSDTKGASAKHLVEVLEDHIGQFLKDSMQEPPSKEKIQQFKADFSALLTQNSVGFDRHREVWKPIIANIFIALTGIGLAALAGNTIYQAIQGKPLSLNNCLFFAKPKSLDLKKEIESDFNNSFKTDQAG